MTWLKTAMSPWLPKAMAFGVASSVVTRWPRRMSPPSSTTRAAAGAGSRAVFSRCGCFWLLSWVFLSFAARSLLRLFVRTEQDVLAGVERLAFEFDGACAATQNTAGLEQRDGHAGFGQCQGCRAAGPAAPHDCDTGLVQFSCHGNSQVLLASHSLRNGVSETRACKTGNPDCRISLSKVR